MTPRVRRALREEGGQTVVLLAVSMPLLLALLLLVLDGGRLFVEHQRLLAAARLSAQAGTSALVETTNNGRGTGNVLRTDAEVRAITGEAIARNLPGERVLARIDIDRPARRVNVTLEKPIDAFLGRLTVRISGSFAAVAAAQERRPSSGPGSVTTPPPVPTPATPPPLGPTPAPVPVVSQAVNTIPVRANIVDIAADAVHDRVYVAHRSTPGVVTAIDGRTQRVLGEVIVGAEPFGIAVDASRERVYVAHVLPGRLTVIDGRALRVVRDVPLVSWRASYVAVDGPSDKVYVTAFPEVGGPSSPNAILVFSGTDVSLVKTLLQPPTHRPRYVRSDTLDPLRRNLVVGYFGVDVASRSVLLEVYNAATDGRLRNIDLPQQANDIATAGTGMAYALTDRVSIANELTGEVTGFAFPAPNILVSGIAANAARGRLYLTFLGPADRQGFREIGLYKLDIGTGRLIDAVGFGVSAPRSGIGVGRLALNAVTGRLYTWSGSNVVVIPE